MLIGFQFHKGAIRTKVTLYYVLRLSFQFHKGAIRTVGLVSNILTPLGFQFHKGAIRTG